MSEHLCPNCGKELTYDEVDIGVGTMIGNVCCEHCGWMPPDISKLFKETP